MKFILGKKLDMSQVWRGEEAKTVTRVQAGPCFVVQVKDKNKDGYQAVQLGYGDKKKKNIKKPQLGHLLKVKKQNSIAPDNIRYLREFKTKEEKLAIGDIIDVSTFRPGDIVKVTGVSKGKGFQGVVKRHHFSGLKKTHGNKDQLRMSGSIGAKGPAHVFKGTRMGGRMGGRKVTVTNLEIVDIDVNNNIIIISGAVPGARNGLLLISGEGELKVKKTGETINGIPTITNGNAQTDAGATAAKISEISK